MPDINYRTICIVNPVAGNGKSEQRWGAIDKVLRREGFQYDVEITRHSGHASQIARAALQKGYDRIVAVGGDGTLNEVVNGLFTDEGEVINSSAGLLLIPVGTGSDFARMFDIDSSLGCVLKLMSLKEAKKCDVIRASFYGHNGQKALRYYINIADVGIGSETCARVNRGSKRLGGFWSFLLAALYTIITYHNRQLTVVIDDKEIYQGPSCLVAAGNGRFFGGGMKIAPEARVDDGVLDVVIVKDFTKLELFANMAKVYRGAHLQHPKVELGRGTRVNIKTAEKAYLELDGEPVGYGNTELQVLPAAIKIMF